MYTCGTAHAFKRSRMKSRENGDGNNQKERAGWAEAILKING